MCAPLSYIKILQIVFHLLQYSVKRVTPMKLVEIPLLCVYAGCKTGVGVTISSLPFQTQLTYKREASGVLV